jgi:drug/metabolite transporter (DMT)-like permease
VAVAAAKGDLTCIPWLQFALMSMAGACLFALPAAAFHFAAGKVSEFTDVAAFCAVPLITVLAASAIGAGDGESSRLRGLMLPSVAGLGGALLLFPLENPGSVRRWLSLGLVFGCCVAVAFAGVWMHRLMQGAGVAAAVAVIGLVSAVLLGSYGAAVGWPGFGRSVIAREMLRCAVFDLPVVWLTVWLVREVSPARLSARFLLVPLVTVAEGYAVERGPLELKTFLAAGLLCASGVLLLIRDEPEEPPGLRLR